MFLPPVFLAGKKGMIERSQAEGYIRVSDGTSPFEVCDHTGGIRIFRTDRSSYDVAISYNWSLKSAEIEFLGKLMVF